MKRTKFKKIMKELIQLKKDEDYLNKALQRFDPDFNYISLGRF